MSDNATMKNTTIHDMTTGSPARLIMQFMIPMFLGNIFQQFYNIADSIIAGQFLGVRALAAIGSTGSLMFFVTGWLNGLSSGFAILVSQWFGAKEYERMRHYVAMSIYLSAGWAVLMTIGLGIANEPILRLMNYKDSIMPDVKAYMGIIYAGLIVTAAYNALAAFLRALGDSKSPLYFLIISAVINVGLDVAFIIYGGMGVEGCAYATVIAQGISAVLCFIYIVKKFPILHLKKENFKLQKEIILPCLALGISTFVMLSTESILSISFTSSLSRYGGDLAVGAMTIITSISQLATLPLQGICQGGQPIMSYNFGAGNRDRVKKAFFTQFTACTVFTGCFWLIMLLFPKGFAGIFSNNTELITYTAWALRIYMAGIFSLGFQVACQQSFMALGQAKVSLLLACLRKLILLIPLIFILPHFIQNKVFAVFLAEPISDILAAIITTSTFFSRFNKILDRK